MVTVYVCPAAHAVTGAPTASRSVTVKPDAGDWEPWPGVESQNVDPDE